MVSAEIRRTIPFNPEVMKWARERVNVGVEDAARRLNVKPERVVAWEGGDSSQFPTVRQARLLADLVGRPFLEFFSRSIPNVKEPALVPDFRFHRRKPDGNEISVLIEVQRWAEEIRLNTLDLLDLIGEEIEPFPRRLFFSVNDNVDEVATAVRDYMRFPIEEQTSLKPAVRYTFPQIFRHELEKLGILVLKQSGLKGVRTRGICLYAETLPIIVFGNESPGATAFTLVHEFAHILLRQSALSSYPRFGNGNEKKKIEGWCNRFAASFLMPAGSIEAMMGKFPKNSDSIEDGLLRAFANRFAVSPHAALIRLVNLGYVKRAFYWRVKRPEFVAQEEEYEGGGRSLYYGSRYRNSRGDLYTGLVLEAWNRGQISNHNAAEFMGIKNLIHLNDIRGHFWSPDG